MADLPSGSALAEALSAAGSAQHEYEQTALKGVRDGLWAGFYAAFVLGRRALIFIDPPFEEQRAELTRVAAAVADGQRRFATGVFALWYPIKEQRVTAAWHAQFSLAVAAPTLVAELWLYPRDSRVALNGSGLLLVNPPWQIEQAMRAWLPELAAALGAGSSGGTEVRMLSQ